MRARWFIAAFLVCQTLIPLQYYGCREDKSDERFAWRMFSTTRMLRCKTEFRVNNQRIQPMKTFHEAWIRVVERGRTAVVRAMAERLCKDNPEAEVRVSMQCTSVTGETTEVAQALWNFCQVGEL